jgi:hypothetical protein
MRRRTGDIATKESLPVEGETRTLSLSYEVTLHELAVDLDRIVELFPYDTTTEDYRKYMKSDKAGWDPRAARRQRPAQCAFSRVGGTPPGEIRLDTCRRRLR